MNTKILILVASVILATNVTLSAKTVAGPKGGRLLELETRQAEFFVNSARAVEISFYDAALKPVSPETHEVSVLAEPASGKIAIPLEKTATGFVARTALPVGEPYRVVVQIRAAPEAKPKNFRIDFNSANCAECDHPEYACTCEGH